MPDIKTNRVVLIASAFLVVVLVLFGVLRDNSSEITLVEAQKILDNHIVKKVIKKENYTYLKTDQHFYKIASSEITPKMLSDYNVEVESGSNFLTYLLFLIIFLGLGSIIFRWLQKNGITLPTSTKKQTLSQDVKKESKDIEVSSSVIEATKSDVSFDDIGGISDVKVELEEIIDFMKNPMKYKKFGARMPRGVLLVGPPGVGKTMIAKAVAHEAGVPFYYQSGASFVQIYVGMGAKRVHELFKEAKKNAPSIIFIDEIDAVGKKRDNTRNDEREATLNQLLTEMDGFEGSSGIIVVAATNKIDVLDSALLRAGRFDRRVFVELPTKQERESILLKYLEKIPNNVDVKAVANMSVGFNGAALAALVNEAALLSLREDTSIVTLEHFHQVKDKVMFGKRKLQMLNDKQKKYRITYQAGKVIVATYFDLPFEKILLSNEKLTPSTDEPLIKDELEARVKMLLSGIIACSIKYAEHASSAKDDLAEAKDLIQKMIFDYGMGEFLIPSEKDSEVLMNRLYNECGLLLKSLFGVFKDVEAELYEKESITKTRVRELIDAVL